MTKKRVIILVGVLVVSFGISFGLSLWLTPPKPKGKEPGPKTDAVHAALQPGGGFLGPDGQPAPLRPDEKQTADLIKELRSRIEQVKLQERKLQEREQRLRMTEAVVKEEVQKLENLRVELVAPLDRLKQAKKELDDSRIRIEQEETANLRSAAAIYDKMSPEESGPVFGSMCKNNQIDDAVKILRFMNERTAAKVLGQIQTSDKDAARKLTDGLKRIQQKG